MNLPTPSIVIFDMDGTVVRHINPRLLHILEWLDDALYRITRFFGWLFMRGAKGAMFFDEDQIIQHKKRRVILHRAMHKLRRKPVEQIVEPCPGIYSVLALLGKHNIPLGLASNGLGAGYGHEVLETFGLEEYFRTTIFREDIRKSKPNPEAILLTLQKMDLKPQHGDVVWYIGDRHKDIKAAEAAQNHLPCRIVPIAYGLHAALAAVERNLSPDHIVMSYYDLYNALKKLLDAPT